ncbi:MAG: hypothetical protein CSA38_00240 [Flavobacteriales bacterium]|nr:MAG: hypothetical protein CSA38_00240 [Flavobacteriales bacterium]
MKILKQTILASLLLAAGFANGQKHKKGMKNMLKVGANVGMVLPTKSNTVASLGIDVTYQYLVNPNFGLGLSTGYTHFFGRDKNQFDNNSVGVVPVSALIRFYPKRSGFYFGTNIGYGFLTGDNQILKKTEVGQLNKNRPDGGLYVKPEVGYHNRDWNFSVHYQKVFTDKKYNYEKQDYNIGSLGIGVAYNIPLGNKKRF